jgi:hypothetical protein
VEGPVRWIAGISRKVQVIQISNATESLAKRLLSVARLLLFLIAATTVTSTNVFAHAGNSDPNVVHACVQGGSNLVRIVGVNGSCLNPETPVHWSIVGPQGPAGPAGPQGPAGVSGWERVVATTNNVSIAPDGFLVFTATCPAGKKILGGGVLIFGPTGFWTVQDSGPLDDITWLVGIGNTQTITNTANSVNVYAICASLQ